MLTENWIKWTKSRITNSHFLTASVFCCKIHWMCLSFIFMTYFLVIFNDNSFPLCQQPFFMLCHFYLIPSESHRHVFSPVQILRSAFFTFFYFSMWWTNIREMNFYFCLPFISCSSTFLSLLPFSQQKKYIFCEVEVKRGQMLRDAYFYIYFVIVFDLLL